MIETRDYQKAINRYQSRITFVALLLILFLTGFGWWTKQWFATGLENATGAKVELKRLEFEILLQGLATKSEPAILEQTVEVEKGIGKLEPFQ